MISEQVRVLIMAGGTGGHVFPALAVAQELRERGIAVEWLGTEQGIEHRVVPADGFRLHTIAIVGLRGKSLGVWLTMPWLLLRALWQARAVVQQFKPQVALGMGGFASGPGGLAMRLAGKPLVLHEQNAVAGTTNRWLAKLTPHRLQAFPGALPKARVVGNPLRKALTQLRKAEDANSVNPATSSADHGHEQGKTRILVLGGSLGARALNQTLPGVFKVLAERHAIAVRHQAGKQHAEAAAQAYQGADFSVEVAPFVEDMAAAYQWADLVICRAGALTVSEVSAAGVAAIFIPFPYAIDDHQTRNAQWLADQGAALVCPEAEITEERLVDLIAGLLASPQRFNDLAANAQKAAVLDAAERVADYCLEVAHG